MRLGFFDPSKAATNLCGRSGKSLLFQSSVPRISGKPQVEVDAGSDASLWMG